MDLARVVPIEHMHTQVLTAVTTTLAAAAATTTTIATATATAVPLSPPHPHPQVEWFFDTLGMDPYYFASTTPAIIAQHLAALFVHKLMADTRDVSGAPTKSASFHPLLGCGFLWIIPLCNTPEAYEIPCVFLFYDKLK
jgi:hypothetical protein